MDLEYLKTRNGYEIDGIWYPRVTSICGIISKPGLEKWLANQENFTVMQIKRRKIADFGSSVHNTIEEIFRNQSPKIRPAIKPSIDAFLNWLNKHRVKTLGIERRILSKKYHYSGTCDVVSEIDGEVGILDLKTSSGIWDDFFIQTAAYVQAYNENSSKKARTHWILRVDQYQECVFCGAKKREKGGAPSVKEGRNNCQHKWAEFKGACEFKEVNDHRTYLEMFLAAQKLWEFSNRDWLSQIENYPHNFR